MLANTIFANWVSPADKYNRTHQKKEKYRKIEKTKRHDKEESFADERN